MAARVFPPCPKRGISIVLITPSSSEFSVASALHRAIACAPIALWKKSSPWS
ncbi:hypothetical protein ACNKHS_00015 [Shigella flexneri]